MSTTVNPVVTVIENEDLQNMPVRQSDIQTDHQKAITAPNIAYVQKVETTIACNSCSRSVVQSSDSKFVHCDRCGSTMRIVDCRLQVCAKVVVNSSEGEKLNLTLFQSTLESAVRGNLTELGEKKIAEALLEFEDLKIKYNTNTFVITELSFV